MNSASYAPATDDAPVTAGGRRRHPDVRLPLGRRTRKAVLVVHIVAAGAWIGLDVVMGVFVFTAMLTDDASTRAISLQALQLFAVWPLLGTGLLCLLSGIVLSLGTKYGLVRYWWVAVKLVANVVLTGLVLVALRPGVVEAAEIGRRIASGEQAALPDQLMFPPIVSTTTLVLAVLLAVYKPWGRVRKP
jgi:uncharacterized membrane protein